MTDLCKTPLHDQHLALGARMVDFGGWSMPLHYGSQLDEHRAVRTAAGMFDVSHMRAIDIGGPRARALLRHVLANDVDKLATPGRALYSCMLNPEGGVIDDLIVYFFEDNAYRLVVNAATAAKDLAWLDRVNVDGGFGADPNGGFGVDLNPRGDLSIIAVQGPQARAKVWEAVGAAQSASEGLSPFHAARIAPTPFGELTIARTGYTGEDGFEIMVDNAHANALWSALAAAGVRPCGLAARDTLRLEAGMNLYGQDMDESVSPLDAGLGWTVDLRGTRDFIGKTALVAQGRRRAFVGLILRGAGGVLRAHQKVVTAHGEGEITSGTFSPTLHGSIAFARVPDTVAVGDTVQVVIRDKPIEASVVKLPFVRHGRILSS